MAEVIYTRKSTENTRDESSNTHDELIEEFLKEIMKREIFVCRLEYDDRFETFPGQLDELGDAELVGSAADGTNMIKMFVNKDFDFLVFSPNLTFDVDDELLFEYRDDDPYFLRIPQPQQLENKTLTVGGVYMSAHDLRFFREPLFHKKTSGNYASFPYDLCRVDEVKSLHKCATTKSIQPPGKEIDVNYTLEDWKMEHTLLTYLLYLRNGNELQFVRELLFGDVEGGCETAREQLGFRLSSKKEIMVRTMWDLCDMSYFNGGDFRKRFESVWQQGETQFDSAVKASLQNKDLSIDYVPAIKCSGWPRPAMDWMRRPRQWPDKNVVENIVSSGFQLVAKSPLINPTPEKDFILSFSQSEIKLIRALPSTAKTSYCLLKLCYKLIKADVSDGPTLKSYHLKTALFWVAEQTPPEMWESKGILWGIRAIINFLLLKLEQGHLPAFFIPESNLIPHFRVHDIKRLSGILRSIHENPVCYIKLPIEREERYVQQMTGLDTSVYSQLFGQIFVSNVGRLSWSELASFYTASVNVLDPIHYTFDNTSQINADVNCLLNCDEGSSTVESIATDDQLKYVDVFAKTVSSFNMDLFNALDQEIDSSLLDIPANCMNDPILKLYPSYDEEEDKKTGEMVYNVMKNRLKNHSNLFHTLCCKLLLSVDRTGMPSGNEDFNYIVLFFNKLKQKYRYSDKNIEDLLHYMYYFCHFTRLRHPSLSIAEQIPRSICEFLQNAKVLMTIYFNPKTLFPGPVVSDNISLLEELNTWTRADTLPMCHTMNHMDV